MSSSSLLESLEAASLLQKHGDKIRVVDVSADEPVNFRNHLIRLKKLGRARVWLERLLFRMQTAFAVPLGDLYEKVLQASYRESRPKGPFERMRTSLAPEKSMASSLGGHQHREGSGSRTHESPKSNVFYELGLAHATQKTGGPLVSSREEDVPFDLHHIRVIYYDVNDPFGGSSSRRLPENILFALN